MNVLQLFENLLREDIIRFKKDSHLENDPRRGMSVRWLAGFTVTIKLELLATIISVTWKDDMYYYCLVIKSRRVSHTSGLLTAPPLLINSTNNFIKSTDSEILLR